MIFLSFFIVVPAEIQMFYGISIRSVVTKFAKIKNFPVDTIQSGSSMIAYSKNTAVSVCTWSINKRKKSLSIDLMCSSRVCKGAGTAILYAAEEVAKTLGLDSISAYANGRAKPFYFKVGLNYDTDEPWSLDTNQRPSSIKRNRSKNNNNTAQSRLRYPSTTMMPMVKRLRQS
jgi:hypothetical protein